MSINEISTSIKGHNSVENERKILFNHSNLNLVNINAYTKFDRSPQNIYILSVFTEKTYSKPLERNVVYIPIITFNHATSHDFK